MEQHTLRRPQVHARIDPRPHACVRARVDIIRTCARAPRTICCMPSDRTRDSCGCARLATACARACGWLIKWCCQVCVCVCARVRMRVCRVMGDAALPGLRASCHQPLQAGVLAFVVGEGVASCSARGECEARLLAWPPLRRLAGSGHAVACMVGLHNVG
eukprot:1003361-Alexandrium_andersonii.AAC.1